MKESNERQQDEGKRSEHLSAEATAEGFVATPTEWYDSIAEKNVKGHTLTFAYVAGEQVFARTMQEVTWYDEGKTYKVYYNPQDPNDWKLSESAHRCGS